MATPKILLYYVFTPLPDPEAIKLWQRSVCEMLGLRGRIIVSPHGINGTVGGDIGACKAYIKALKQYPAFKNVDMKWSDGSGLDDAGYSLDFPRLSVKVRPEIVSFGAPEELNVDENGVIGGGTHLAPHELHDFVSEHPDAVFFDGRNSAEAEVGRFKGAVVPDTVTTHDFVRELDSGKFDDLKDRPVITYCTGGVRCEVLSVLMKNRGFTDVYQLDGGIVRYGEAFGNDGLWEGALTVFDGREEMTFPGGTQVISACTVCGQPTSRLQNCVNQKCQHRLVVCENCGVNEVACTQHAHELA